MKIEIEDTGAQYTDFISATATISIDNLTNTFSFTSGIGKKIDLDFGIDNECVIYIEGERIITGHIEVISGRGGPDNSSIDIIGRDKTGDIVDSAIGSLDDIKAPITLKAAIEIVIAHIGADIDVVDFLKASFSKTEDLLAPESGDNAFDYIDKLARNKSAILSSNDEGNVVIQRNIGIDIDAHLINDVNGPNNNVLSYKFDFDHTNRFRKYLSISNSNIGLIDLILKAVTSKEAVNKQDFVLDGLSREGRQFVIAAENPGPASQQKERAQWESNIRKARSRTYTAKVNGFRNQTGEIWTTNTVVKVIDENAKINDRMLINSVTYRMDLVDGKTTEIKLVNRDAYTLEATEPQDDKAVNPLDRALSAIKTAVGIDDS